MPVFQFEDVRIRERFFERLMAHTASAAHLIERAEGK